MKTIKKFKKKNSNLEHYELEVVGHSSGKFIHFCPEKTKCGHIFDGVSLDIGLSGSFVIEADDLITMSNIVKKLRREHRR